MHTSLKDRGGVHPLPFLVEVGLKTYHIFKNRIQEKLNLNDFER